MPTFKKSTVRQLTEPNRTLVSPKALYPVDDYDVPLLIRELQPLKVDLPWDGWGTIRQRRCATGTFHFYIDDGKFAAIFENPWKVSNLYPHAIVEPNCSTDLDTPLAYLLGMIYAKRWVARTWQASGVPVYVDVNFAPEQARWQLLGVPPGWRSYATRGCSDYFGYNLDQYEIACERAGTRNILFVVVGGGEKLKQQAQKRGWVWVPDVHQRIRGRIE